MLECPYCYRVMREAPEKIGARCPKCRMPLFEGASKKRRPEQDLGECKTHPESQAIAVCARCGVAVCAACRTRWHDEPCCPSCVVLSVADDEPTANEVRLQFRAAVVSLGAAIFGWCLVLLIFWPLSMTADVNGGRSIKMAGVLFCLSFLPALVALGQGLSALRLRGDATTLAAWGLGTAGSQLGVLFGLLLFNLWNN